MNMAEFTPYPPDPRYGVTRDGRVCCFQWMHNWPPGVRVQHLAVRGYYVVSVDGKNVPVHKMVAETFIPNPENKPEVAHNDGVRIHNNAANLRWATRKENSDDMDLHKTRRLGEAHPSRKLSLEEVLKIKKMFIGKIPRERPFYYEVAEAFGVTRKCIAHVVTGRNWSRATAP